MAIIRPSARIKDWDRKKLNRTMRNMKAVTDEVLPKHVVRALRLTARSVYHDTRARVQSRTGRMKSAYKIVPMRRKRRAGQLRWGYRVVIDRKTLGTTIRNFYPQYVELGAPKANIKAQAMMRKAAWHNRNVLRNAIIAQSKRAWREIDKKGRREA